MIPAHQELESIQLLQPGDSALPQNAATCADKAALLLQNYCDGGSTDAGLLLQAKQLASRALAIAQDDDHATLCAAELILCDLARLTHADWRQVEGMYERLLDKYPANAATRHNLGLLYLDWNPAKAVPQFVMAGRLAPPKARNEIGLARAYVKLHDYGLAGAAVERAKQLEPENPEIKPLYDQVSRRGWAPL